MHKMRKTSVVHTSSHKPTKKCAIKMKQRNTVEEKNDVCIKMLLMEGSRRTQRTGENNLNERRVSNSEHNEGTICLLNGQMGAKGMIFRSWAHE